MATVICDEIMTPQSYLEFITGECYAYPSGLSDLEFIRQHTLSLRKRDYALSDLKGVMESKADGVILVFCLEMNPSRYEPRWFEV